MVRITTKESQKSPYLDEVTEADAVPSFDSIESALEGFREKVFEDLKLFTSGVGKSKLNYQREDFVKSCASDTNDSNTFSASTSIDSSVIRQKEKECNDSVTYPTSCRFCGGMLRAIDKHREDGMLTLQCRRRKCIRFNGVTADKNAKQFLSEMAKPKASQINYGWYLSDPVRHSYRIFASHGDPSDSEVDRSNVDVRPIIRNGNIMLRVFGQRQLAKLL
ncbi:hypothetical protein LOAG_07162 [Loa loa]|uniref:Nuclear receptor domain-containing protein n=1 Tax=Loa loa TaxID=7209 RepID=A0A1I7W3V5_LOALO|nr:hypothetical protein LOAG_07162 [Loa loa]EFO21326.1 hypothetical protein LOAG_07162 [Loa loa]